MTSKIQAIIVSENSNFASEFGKALQSQSLAETCRLQTSLHEAVQLFLDNEFQLCFLAATFEEAEITDFLKDLASLKRRDSTVIVQVRESLPEDFDLKSITSLGFNTVVSAKISERDKSIIRKQLIELAARDIPAKRVNVDEALRLLMLEIDRVSKNRKRGRKDRITRKSLGSFLATQLDGSYAEVLEAYFHALEEYSNKGKPFKVKKLSLPGGVADPNFPGIVDGEYTGTSLRVWEMLQQKFGEISAAPENLKDLPKTKEQKVPGKDKECLTNHVKEKPEKVE